MKRYWSVGLLLLLALAVSALVQAPVAGPANGGLAGWLPAGALLVLEAKDFSSLVRDWSGSAEKKLWLAGDNFQVFSRSGLYLRLENAQKEFAGAAGFLPDMSLVDSVAGSESALALYDIGNLEFLYVTRLPTAKAVESALWRMRADYQPRQAGGLPYYVRREPVSRRVVAFAATGEYLLLATREELISGALTRMARRGEGPGSVTGERWFQQAVRSAGEAGDLRMVMNMEALVRTPHFRSYWIQHNVSDLRRFSSGISDVRRSATENREERVLIRSEAAEAPAAGGAAALDEALALAPDDAGLYRVWAAPPVDRVMEMLEQKVLAPRLAPGSIQRPRQAPSVALDGGETGSESDLETRIDEAPLGNVGGTFVSPPLRKLLESVNLQAMLVTQSSRPISGNVFVGNQATVVLVAASDWNGQAARAALGGAVESLWSTSRLGVNWVERKSGAQPCHVLDGLARVAVAMRGRFLIVSESAECVPMGGTTPAAGGGGGGAVYAAGFRHARERGNFVKMMRLMEQPEMEARRPIRRSQEQEGESPREPLFFSENIGSLSRALARMESASILVRDTGSAISQTVIYRMAR